MKSSIGMNNFKSDVNVNDPSQVFSNLIKIRRGNVLG